MSEPPAGPFVLGSGHYRADKSRVCMEGSWTRGLLQGPGSDLAPRSLAAPGLDAGGQDPERST